VEERQQQLKQCRGALQRAQASVAEAKAAVRRKGALDVAVAELLSRSRKGACPPLVTFLL
jgi:hypothetical protein